MRTVNLLANASTNGESRNDMTCLVGHPLIQIIHKLREEHENHKSSRGKKDIRKAKGGNKENISENVTDEERIHDTPCRSEIAQIKKYDQRRQPLKPTIVDKYLNQTFSSNGTEIIKIREGTCNT